MKCPDKLYINLISQKKSSLLHCITMPLIEWKYNSLLLSPKVSRSCVNIINSHWSHLTETKTASVGVICNALMQLRIRLEEELPAMQLMPACSKAIFKSDSII